MCKAVAAGIGLAILTLWQGSPKPYDGPEPEFTDDDEKEK